MNRMTLAYKTICFSERVCCVFLHRMLCAGDERRTCGFQHALACADAAPADAFAQADACQLRSPDVSRWLH